jgi:hypothetical protein
MAVLASAAKNSLIQASLPLLLDVNVGTGGPVPNSPIGE